MEDSADVVHIKLATVLVRIKLLAVVHNMEEGVEGLHKLVLNLKKRRKQISIEISVVI